MPIGLGLGLNLATLGQVSAGIVVDTAEKVVALLGDSITANNSNKSNPNALSYQPHGIITQLNTLTGQRYAFQPSHNLGVSGETSSQIEARKTDLAALSPAPNLVFVLAGTNDILGAATDTDIEGNLASIYDYVTGTLGGKVIALTIPPRTEADGSALTAPHLAKLQAVNAWIVAQADGTSIFVADIFDAMTDGGTGPDTALFINETVYVHPNPKGAYAAAVKAKADLDPYFGSFDIPDMSQASLLTNPTLSGTGGTVSAPMTGSAPTSFVATGTASGSGTSSKPTTTTWGLAYSRTGGSSADLARGQQVVNSGYSAGDVVYVEAEIELVAGSRLTGLMVQIVNAGGTSQTHSGPASFNSTNFPTDARTVHLRTPNMTIPSGSTSITARVQATMDSTSATTGSVDYIVKQMRLKKVA